MQHHNSPNADGSDAATSGGGSLVECILHGRFLVQEDLTDVSLGGSFTVVAVKDLKRYCRAATLKLSPPPPEGVQADGPSLAEVAEVLRRLSHPNIEEVLETGCFPDGRHYILTEPNCSASLGELLAPDRRLEISGIAAIVEQVADALGIVHSKGILHCDLRPSNILVPEGDIGANPVTIINFGAGWPVDARGEGLCRVRPGTESLFYAAPEMLVTLGHRSPASDTYALAVLAYRLVTGDLPFAGTEREDLLKAINAGTMASLTHKRTDLPERAAALIRAGLEFEPASRPRNIAEFGRGIARSLEIPQVISIQTGPHAAAQPVAMPPQDIGVEKASEPEPEQEWSLTENEAEVDLAKPSSIRPTLSDRTISWALIILLMAGALAIPIGQLIMKGETKTLPAETFEVLPQRNRPVNKLRYWLKTHIPVTSSFHGVGDIGVPEELEFASESKGETYIFTEVTGPDGRPAYRLVFPGSDKPNIAELSETGQRLTTVSLRRGGSVENFIWIVWTPGADDDLRSILASVPADGMIDNGDDRRRLRHFLERNRGVRVTESRDPATGQAVLEGSGDRIVFRIDPNEVVPQPQPPGTVEKRRAALA